VERPSANIGPGTTVSNDWPPMSERGPHVTDAAIVALETQLGTKLPDDYRVFLLEVNGGQTELSHTRFMLVTRKGRRDWTRLNSLNSLDDPDDQFNLATRWMSSHHQFLPAFPDIPPELPDLPPEVLPIGYDGFGGTVGLVVAGPHRGEMWSSTASIHVRKDPTHASNGSIGATSRRSPTRSAGLWPDSAPRRRLPKRPDHSLGRIQTSEGGN